MQDDNKELVKQLAALAEEGFLARVTVTAKLEDDGKLGGVEAVNEKIKGLINRQGDYVLGILGLATAQKGIFDNHEYSTHIEGHSLPHLLGASSLRDLVGSLHVRQRGRKNVDAIDYLGILRNNYPSYLQEDDWLFPKIESSLGDPKSPLDDDFPYRVLICGPGVGKTAFSLEFIRRFHLEPFGNWILGGWHLLRKAHPNWNNPTVLVGQLELRLRRNLVCPLAEGEADERIDEENRAGILIKAIRNAAERAVELGKGVLILVDGLDEAFGDSAYISNARMNHLLELFPKSEFPKNVRVLFTSRPGSHLAKYFYQRPEATITLEGCRNSIDRDIRKYLDEKLADPAEQLYLQKEELLDRMVNACEGTFLVADYFARKAQDQDELKAWANKAKPLPMGLKGMVRDEWIAKCAQLASKSVPEKFVHVLGATLALRQQAGLSGNKEAVYQLLVKAAGNYESHNDTPPNYVGGLNRRKLENEEHVDLILECLTDWFEDRSCIFRFYHSSIPEILLDPIHNLIEQRLITDLHALLAWRCRQWPTIEDPVARSIALALAPWHGALSGKADELNRSAQLLSDPAYLQATYDSLGEQALVHLERAYAETLKRLEHEDQISLLLNISRSLVTHDAILANGSLSVAAALYNDLGGLDKEKFSEQLRKLANERTGLLRCKPGRPSKVFAQQVSLDHAFYVSSRLLFSPCGQWLVVCDPWYYILIKLDKSELRINTEIVKHGETGQNSLEPNHAFSPTYENGRTWLAINQSFSKLTLIPIGPNEIDTDEVSHEFSSPIEYITFMPIIEGCSWLACLCMDNTIHIIPVLSNNVLWDRAREIKVENLSHRRFTVSPAVAGRIWLAYENIFTLTLLSVDPQGNVTERFRKTLGEIFHVAFSPLANGKVWLAAYSVDRETDFPSADKLASLYLLPIEGEDPREDSSVLVFPDAKELGLCCGLVFSPSLGREVFLAAAFRGHIGILPIGGNGCRKDDFYAFKANTPRVSPECTVRFAPVTDGSALLTYASYDGRIHIQEIQTSPFKSSDYLPIEGHSWKFEFCRKIDGRVILASLWNDHLLALSCELGNRSNVDVSAEYHDWISSVAISPLVSDRVLMASISDRMGTLYTQAIGQTEEARSSIGNFDGGALLAFSPLIGETAWLACGPNSPPINLLPFKGKDVGNPEILDTEPAFASITGLQFSPSVGDHVWLSVLFWKDLVGLLPLGSEVNQEEFQTLGGHEYYPGAAESWEVETLETEFSHVIGDRIWHASILDSANEIWWAIGLQPIDIKRRKVIHDEFQMIRLHKDIPTTLKFSPITGGRLWLVTFSLDRTFGFLPIDTYGIHTDQFIRADADGCEPIRFAFSPAINDEAWLAFVNENRTVGLKKVGSEGPEQQLPRMLRGHRLHANILCYFLASNGTLLLASASECEVIVWSVTDSSLLARADFSRTSEIISDMAWGSDGRLLYVAGIKGGQAIDLTLIVPEQLLN